MDNQILVNAIISAIAFVIIFIFFYLRDLKRFNSKKKKDRKKQIAEVKYLMLRNNIKEEYLLKKWFFALTAGINAFIISSVFFLIELLSWHIVLRLMLGFILTLGLIYSIYGILGNILEKRSNK